jgi:uncharacterized protein
MYKGPVLVFSDETCLWDVTGSASLTSKHFGPIITKAENINLCLLGCGHRMHLVHPDLGSSLQESGINI